MSPIQYTELNNTEGDVPVTDSSHYYTYTHMMASDLQSVSATFDNLGDIGI